MLIIIPNMLSNFTKSSWCKFYFSSP